jgi:hypothetical protein
MMNHLACLHFDALENGGHSDATLEMIPWASFGTKLVTYNPGLTLLDKIMQCAQWSNNMRGQPFELGEE